jgi:Down syndrome cell adhesion molecule-like protein 1
VPPAITPFTFGELSLGERVKVTCSVKRGDMPLSISWMKDRRPIVEHATKLDNVDIRDIEDSYSSILAISSVSSRHSGNYTCVARNPAKETTYTAELVVTGNVPKHPFLTQTTKTHNSHYLTDRPPRGRKLVKNRTLAL